MINYKIKTIITLTGTRHEAKKGQYWILSFRSKCWNLFENESLIMSIPEKLIKETEKGD
mgnify:FL=1